VVTGKIRNMFHNPECAEYHMDDSRWLLPASQANTGKRANFQFQHVFRHPVAGLAATRAATIAERRCKASSAMHAIVPVYDTTIERDITRARGCA
jgi:hypothetical protein